MDLVRTKRGLTASALAQRRQLPVRMVYRDLHALEAAGFPITNSDGARWTLVEGWEAKVPFPLPVGQLLALHLARSFLKPIRATPVARDFDALYERLVGQRDGSPSQGELFPHLHALLATRSQLALDYSEHRALIETLSRACVARLTIRAVYFSDSGGKVMQRQIDPYCLYYDPQLEALYLFGWCHVRRALRTFAVHRFRQASQTQSRFEIPSSFSIDKYLQGAFRIWRGENSMRVRIMVDRKEAGWIAERRWHASQVVSRHADGSCEVTFTVDSVQEVKRFVLQLGAAGEVIEPEWFRREVADEHARAAQRYPRQPRRKMSLNDTARGDKRRGA